MPTEYHDPPDLRTAALAAMEDGHFDEAVATLRTVLADEPHDGISRAVLALCLGELDRLDEAEAEASRAVVLEPFLPFAHWVQGALLARRGRTDAAFAPAREALRLDRDDGDHHALVAQLHAAKEQWQAALAQAEAGLRHDPGHAGCANLRALALRALGRTDEAARAFDEAVSANPMNAFAAAGKGWHALAGGEHEAASAHFRDAMLVDPGSEWAREGLIAALKSRNAAYRALLRVLLWMGRGSRQRRAMLLVAGIVGFNVLRRAVEAEPALAPVIWPVLGLYLLFIAATWLADPLLDLGLSFDAEGRRLLGRDRLLGARLVVGALVAAIVLGVLAWFVPARVDGLTALAAGALALPLSAVMRCERGWPRRTLAAYCGGLAVLVVASVVPGPDATPAALALLGAVLGTWLASWLSSVVPQR